MVEHTTQKVTIIVNPDLEVPKYRLDVMPLECIVENKYNLLDEGALSKEPGDERILRDCHQNGFIAAATSAFANHYPLALKPQHFWLLILQAVATHVNLNAEEVRKNWVAHDRLIMLEVRADEFVKGENNNWASVIDDKPGSFAKQIEKNIVAGLVEELVPKFSSITPAEKIALKVTVMDACKSFFSYKVTTMCGFPSIILEGSENDWKSLKANANKLISKRCTAEFYEWWWKALEPLLDKLSDEYVKASQNQPSHEGDTAFWNSFVKRGGSTGSGQSTWFSGWMNIFFPFILNVKNDFMVPYSEENNYVKEGLLKKHQAETKCSGPDSANFPNGLATVPVKWEYLGQEFSLEFIAGFVGATQDRHTRVIQPHVGWFIELKEDK